MNRQKNNKQIVNNDDTKTQKKLFSTTLKNLIV